MPRRRTTALVSGWLLTAAAAMLCVSRARGSDFTAFAEDEAVCRNAGSAAIDGASGPTAAQRYDGAYRTCMAAHWRMRFYVSAAPPAAEPPGNPHGFDYPDAFYSVPYATPGYGYDGFSD